MPFDPYQHWLQIPPERHPPSSHALLGLPEGESDPARIHQSASERYEHVRKYILGPYREQAQRILTELSRAVAELTSVGTVPVFAQRKRDCPLPADNQGTVPVFAHRERDRPLPDNRDRSVANSEEPIARLSAQTVDQAPSAAAWPSSFRDWLRADGEPTDVYHLLGRLRLDPDREGLIADVLAARDDLVPYRNHHHAPLARRAARLERLLRYAEEILADADRLQSYGEVLQQRLREAYSEAEARDEQPWTAEQLVRWLEREQWVHPYALAATARNLSANGSLDWAAWKTGSFQDLAGT